MPLIVAIDGPAGAGKSTVARRVAMELGFTYLDTGAMYRAVAWKALLAGIGADRETELAHIAEEMQLVFGPLTLDALQPVMLDGADVTTVLRTPEVSSLTSTISAWPAVRRIVVAQQQRIGEAAPNGVVLEGRDIGTVVFPDAAVKIFLTASPQERARRRVMELQARGLEVDEEQILAEQIARDDRDSHRETSPLVPAPDAMLLDTDALPIDSVVERIVEQVRQAQKEREAA